MDDEVDLMCQIQESSPTPPISFKKTNTSHAEFRRNSTISFPSVPSTQGGPRKAVLLYNTFKSNNQNHAHCLVLSKYAISTRSVVPNSRK